MQEIQACDLKILVLMMEINAYMMNKLYKYLHA